MTRNTFTAATRRTVTCALTACVLAAALPQFGFAADAGIWKIDPAKSTFNSRSARLAITRVEGVTGGAGSFIVISGASVYRVTGNASHSQGLKPVDFANMARTGEAVLIGTHPRSPDPCGFACRAGLPEPIRTVTFRVVKSGEQQIRDMLASDNQNW